MLGQEHILLQWIFYNSCKIVTFKEGKKIILRCPIIPGVNDRDDHFEGIANLVKELPNLAGVELMAYHDIGRDKAVEIGMNNNLSKVENATEQMKQSWLAKLKNYNCSSVTIG